MVSQVGAENLSAAFLIEGSTSAASDVNPGMWWAGGDSREERDVMKIMR